MARAALDAKAEELVILDLRKLSYSFDFFFLCNASSERRLETISDHILEVLSGEGVKPFHHEGRPEGGWLLLDFRGVVGHVFSSEARAFYALERLWSDAPRLKVPVLPAPKKKSR